MKDSTKFYLYDLIQLDKEQKLVKIYNWVKTGHITKSVFIELVEEVTKTK